MKQNNPTHKPITAPDEGGARKLKIITAKEAQWLGRAPAVAGGFVLTSGPLRTDILPEYFEAVLGTRYRDSESYYISTHGDSLATVPATNVLEFLQVELEKTKKIGAACLDEMVEDIEGAIEIISTWCE